LQFYASIHSPAAVNDEDGWKDYSEGMREMGRGFGWDFLPFNCSNSRGR